MAKKKATKKEVKKAKKPEVKKAKKPKPSPEERYQEWKAKQVATREGKLNKVAGNLTHFTKDDLIKAFLGKLSDDALHKVYLSSEKIRSEKVKNSSKAKIKVRKK